jgi:CheY-like chemotaxis protein
MGADPLPRPPGSFHALGERLLRDAFPAMGREAVENYLSRAEARVRRAAATHPLPEPPAAAVPQGQAEPVVLLVDDEEDLRDIMQRMLERRGFQTLVASDADKALQLCRDYPGDIDLVVTDPALPRMGSGEFVKAAAALRPHAPTVFLSGLPREIAITTGLVTEDDLFLKKPFSAEQLIAVLRAAPEFFTEWPP